MDLNGLVELRQKIIDESLPEVMGSIGSPEDRADLIINIIRSGREELDLYKQAFDAIRDVSDKNIKVKLMFDLLSLIDSSIKSSESVVA